MSKHRYQSQFMKLEIPEQKNVIDNGLSKNMSSEFGSCTFQIQDSQKVKNFKIESQSNKTTDINILVSPKSFERPILKPSSNLVLSPQNSIHEGLNQSNPNKDNTFDFDFKANSKQTKSKQSSNEDVESNNNNQSKIRNKNRNLSTDSSMKPDDYFCEDTEEILKKKHILIEPENFYLVDEHQIFFDYQRFLYVFLIHELYYIFFGPLIMLYIYIKHGYPLLYNLGFTMSKTVWFIIQNVVWVFNSFIIIYYIVIPDNKIFLVEILFLNVLITLRSCVVAGKYATLHPQRWQLYQKRKVTFDFMAYDYYQLHWSQQDQKTQYQETYNSILRGQYDTSLFYLSFFVNPKPEKVKSCNNHIKNYEKLHKKQSLLQPESLFETPDSQIQIYGYGIIGEIITNFKKTFPQADNFGTKSKATFLLTLCRASLLIGYRYVTQEEVSFTTLELIQLIGLTWMVVFTYFSQLIFLYQYFRDLKLKQYCQEQCSMMIDIKRQLRSYKKLFPTIDITNPYSLKSWSILRRVLFDYGQQFDLRMQTYFSINMIFFILTLIIFSLWFFGVYQFPGEYVIVSIYEIVVWLVFLSIILYKGALINSQFQTNLNILSEHRVLALDLLRLRKQYFLENIVPTNFIIKKGVERMREELQHKYKTTEIQEIWVIEMIENVLNSIEDCEKELQADLQNRPFTFFEIKITTGILQTIVAGLVTLIGACANYYFLNN